jgi:hypothetical protein
MGIVASVLIALGVCVLLAGTVMGLAIAGDPLAVAVAVGLGVSGMFGAVCAYFQLRVPPPVRRGLAWIPLLSGPPLRLAASVSAVLLLWAFAFAFPPSCPPAAAALGTTGVLGALWCATSVRRRPRWTDDDLEWLKDNGAALPEATERQQ